MISLWHSPPSFICKSKHDHKHRHSSTVLDMLADDVQDAHSPKPIAILDAFQLLLASSTHIEGIASIRVELFDADDRLLLKPRTLSRCLMQYTPSSVAYNQNKSYCKYSIAKAHGTFRGRDIVNQELLDWSCWHLSWLFLLIL